jgi:outer membrane protein OmpA-like peptidoglycan-associated protein
MLFAVGEARLTPDTIKVLEEVVRVIRGHRNIIQVKGHTSLDDFPERSRATPEQQMDLSLRRAKAAADHLIARGVTPDIIRVQGCSAFEPVVLRTYTPDAQSFNRRVEVEATDVLVPERQGNGNVPPAPTAVTTADRPAAPASPGPAEPAAFQSQ